MKKTLIFAIWALLFFTQAVAQYSSHLPLVREGVRWVNEKVIVNQGDTTRYYYNYEIRGDYDDFSEVDSWTDYDGLGYKACFYYTGNELDLGTDSLIAGLKGDTYNTYCGMNHAYDAVDHLFRLNEFPSIVEPAKWMYCFYEVKYDGLTENIIDFYLSCQDITYSGVYPRDPYLTHDNFTEVGPVEIEGKTCRRWSIVGEQGDTLAYVVEGIGFDSRDMGDLLTPFTLRPDPDADHQEWCGLSHVVKDGEIIYKGMRYRSDVHVGIDEAVADRPGRTLDGNYYDLTGRNVGRDVPATPGIYIHQGKKIVVR